MQAPRLFLRFLSGHRLRLVALIAAASIASALPAHALQCEAGSPERFEAFIERFSTDKAFSLARTRLPLPVTRLNTDDLDAPPVRSQSTRADLERQPTLTAFIRKTGLSAATEISPPGVARYRMFKPDSDWLMVYHFRLHGNCWRLERFENQSL